MLPSHNPPAVSDQHLDGRSPPPLTPFQQTQLEAEEAFYAVFPAARLAKLAERQLMSESVSAFLHEVHPERSVSRNCHVDSSGTDDFLHYDYGLSNTNPIASFHSIPSTPNHVSGSGFTMILVHSGHHNSSPLEYTYPPRLSEPYFPSSPVPALLQAFSHAPAAAPPMLELFEPCQNQHFPQQPAPFEQAYTTNLEMSSHGYFYPLPPDTPSGLPTSPRIEDGDMQDGVFRSVVPSQPRHPSSDGGRTIERHRRSQGRLTLSSSSHARRNHDHHRPGHGHRLSRSHSYQSLPRQPERVPQPSAGSRPTPPGPSTPLSLLPSKRQLEKKAPFACLFCRSRKVACRPPMCDSPNKTCNQCQRRSLLCQYPSESRRAVRNKMDGW